MSFKSFYFWCEGIQNLHLLFFYCVIEDSSVVLGFFFLRPLSPYSLPQTVRFIFFQILHIAVLSKKGGWKASANSVGFSITCYVKQVDWDTLEARKG